VTGIPQTLAGVQDNPNPTFEYMDVFVTRQPIFDTQHRILAYELLHRSGSKNGAELSAFLASEPDEGEGEQESGIRGLTGGKTALVGFSRDALVAGIPDGLDPRGVIIQLHGSVSPDDEVVSTCRQLADQGFRFSMGDFVLHEKYARLLRLAEVVRIDVQAPEAEEKVALAEKLGDFKGKLLAEKVENQTAHEYCKALGFQLFQGFHYFRQETLSNKDLSTHSVSVVRILNLIRDMQSSDSAIQEAFGTDPSLSYKLLKLVNSAAMGGRGIDSIGHALRLMGREPLYRWLSMLLLADGKDQTEVRAEIVKSSLLRGRMCELIGEGCPDRSPGALPSGGTLFLIGLFSQLDTLLQTPMAEILSRISLADGVEEALMRREGTAGAILSAVESYEDADWDAAEERLATLGADAENLSNLYLDSVTWASNRMEMTGD
jgi:EAL and modified HD-GYP domain-containing signal transduction protein